ncbi:MAG TPA: sulfite exporter TauE/SafE family protein [Cryomorphaceae bacterium]|nr:sulfite exporter TauE/SafE family protein [Cryomorphaceae bacterium]
MLEILGFAAALIIGISLGLIGGGGSILTVPVLVYLLGISPVMATAYSLFIVGATSLAGSYSFYKRNLVSLKTALIFGVPSVVMVYITRRYIVPAIPEEIVTIGESLAVTKGMLLMVLFALLMVFASYSMIKGRKKLPETDSDEVTTQKFNYPAIIAEGVVVGLLTGLVGAGGGFLIIPALVIFSKLKMKLAVGTSLLIIAAKSLFGFLGDISNYTIDWKLLLIFTSISIVGIFIGSALSKKVSGDKLKTGFGWFVLLMGIYILIKELLINN